MKMSVVWAVAAAIITTVGIQAPCLAGENNAGGVLGALAGAVVPAAELGGQRARGIKITNVDTNYTVDSGAALSAGALKGNAVIGTSDTGTITTTGSINGNTGFTTVFQNTGNNSLFQQTTSINITLAK
ncbi:MAG: hypothetical protein JO095_17820 [Alphaproteobacteria bacterium]|nr:hypothetical protein [Alphaproteobacteria bacterium]MBV9200609.1 hypothetical protein [Alphaproteobacteria bacterium]